MATTAPDLEPFIQSLHDYLASHLPGVWQLTIADNGSSDGSWPLAVSLANELPSTRAVRIEQRLGRKELRFRWSESKALVAAFLEIKPESDVEKTLTPLIRSAVETVGNPRTDAATSSGLTRRSALVAIGTVGLSAFLAACARAAGNGVTSTSAVRFHRQPPQELRPQRRERQPPSIAPCFRK